MGVATRDRANQRDRNRQSAVQPSTFRQALSDRDLDELVSVLDSATRLFSAPQPWSIEEIENFTAAKHALDSAWQAVSSALRGDPRIQDLMHTGTDLVDLLTDIRQVDNIIRIADTERRRQALNAVRGALGRFHDVSSVPELISMAPEIVCELGFDRAIISRISDSMWLPDSAHIPDDPEWADQILQAGLADPQRIGPALFESEIVRRRAGIRVTDVQKQDKVHKQIAEASMSRSYVAAPVMPGSDVIGFLHADRYYHRGEIDEFDLDLLSLFAEGLGYSLQRATMLQRMDSLRNELNTMTGQLSSRMDGLAEAPITLDPSEANGSTTTRRHVSPHTDMSYAAYHLAPESPLTRRELDVLKLMATGDTNARIANRLIVSEGTVKTHVKSVLRKLSATNRAEAVARWLNLERKMSQQRPE